MSTHPLTLQRLQEMKAQFDKDYSPSKFGKSADMSRETWKELKNLIPGYSSNGQDSRAYFEITGPWVDIHFVPSIPFGEVEPCRCAERGFHKTEGVEFTQTLPIEEVKRRWPNTKIPGETK
jgi:hypothetical protein